MNNHQGHHFRSQSEQYRPQVAVASQPVESFVRVHIDSQQSLDRLFNPPSNSVPLRNRNLPRSFFEPNSKPEDEEPTISTTTNGLSHHQSLHTRSVSYGQQPQPRLPRNPGNNFHQRTRSILAPMPDTDSGQSSLECINTTQGAYEQQQAQPQAQAPPPPLSQPVSSTTDVIQHITQNQHPNQHQHSNQHHHHHHHHHQQQHAMRSDWYSPATSMEDLNGLPGDVAHGPDRAHQQPLANPPAVISHPNHSALAAATPQAPAPEPQPHPQAQPPQSMAPNSAFYPPPTTNGVGGYGNNFHNRSMSFDQHRSVEATRSVNQNNFHTRTHSTIVPMQAGLVVPDGPPPYHPASQEFANYAQNNQSANGWSSSGYSSDDMTTINGNNFWTPGSQQQVAAPVEQTSLLSLVPQPQPPPQPPPQPRSAASLQPPQPSLQEIGAVTGPPHLGAPALPPGVYQSDTPTSMSAANMFPN